MTNERESREPRIAKGVKNAADAAFDNIQQGVEKAEDVAMNAVGRTAKAVNRLTDNEQEK